MKGAVERLTTRGHTAAGRRVMSPASAVSHCCSILLPSQPTPLVGREGELATIHDRLADEATRLPTLTGRLQQRAPIAGAQA